MPTDKSIWDKEIAVPASVIQYVDTGVQKKLPPGLQVQGIEPSGASYWARTAKITTLDEAGEEVAFFIKVHQNETGKAMASSEYEAMKALHAAMSELVAEPIGWGEYEEEPNFWFFLCRFCELDESIPDVDDFPKRLAEMHVRAQSEKAQFGFPIITFGGRNPTWFPLTDTWEETFTRALERGFEMDEEVHGPDEELTRLREAILTKVVPRLIRPLETEGRRVIPTLLHGDLWDGNAAIDCNTGLPVIFDATPVCGHNEYELAPWWISRHKMTDAYIAEYMKHYEPAEPVEDFADRGHLYSLRFNLHASSLYEGNPRMRHAAMDTMRMLVEKFPLGYAGYLNEAAAKKNAGLDSVVGRDEQKEEGRQNGTDVSIGSDKVIVSEI